VENENLLKRLSRLGYPLFESEEALDANATLADVVKSKDPRLWEGFPVLLANSAEKGLFDYDKVKWCLKKPLDKPCLNSLVLMSLALYKVLDLKFSWAVKLYRSLSKNAEKEFNVLYRKLTKNLDFEVGHQVMSAQRVKNTFNNYFRETETRLDNLVSMKEEYALEYSLSQVFSPKQRELFLKKLRREKLTKTEKEYFSRVVKKKALALANPELHRLSQRLLG
jgi:hypothetical protein